MTIFKSTCPSLMYMQAHFFVTAFCLPVMQTFCWNTQIIFKNPLRAKTVYRLRSLHITPLHQYTVHLLFINLKKKNYRYLHHTRLPFTTKRYTTMHTNLFCFDLYCVFNAFILDSSTRLHFIVFVSAVRTIKRGYDDVFEEWNLGQKQFSCTLQIWVDGKCVMLMRC